MYNCPNCGAPRKDSVCEYCGTQFDIPQKPDKSELAILQQKLSTLRNEMMADRLYSDAINEIGSIKPLFPNQILAIQKAR